MDFLHEHGVKGYVAFNVLIFTDELAAAEEELRLLDRAGVDAAIVQDLGLVSLARDVAPNLHVHASTQMTLTSPEGVAFAKKLGVKQAVLARELSLRELAKFRQPSEVAAAVPSGGSARGAKRRLPRFTPSGGLRSRRTLRRLFRPVPDQRGARPAQRESWRMRPGLPSPLRD